MSVAEVSVESPPGKFCSIFHNFSASSLCVFQNKSTIFRTSAILLTLWLYVVTFYINYSYTNMRLIMNMRLHCYQLSLFGVAMWRTHELDWFLSSENNRTVTLLRHAKATKWQLSAIISHLQLAFITQLQEERSTRSTSQGKRLVLSC